MHARNPLDGVESAVLARMGDWRAAQVQSPALPAGAMVVTVALLAGLVFGWTQARQVGGLPASESVVVASDAGLPSMLLADN